MVVIEPAAEVRLVLPGRAGWLVGTGYREVGQERVLELQKPRRVDLVLQLLSDGRVPRRGFDACAQRCRLSRWGRGGTSAHKARGRAVSVDPDARGVAGTIVIVVADRYYFDFRNRSMREWYVAEYFGDQTGLANPNVDG